MPSVIEKVLFDWSSRLTERYPAIGSRWLDGTVFGLLSHPGLARIAHLKNIDRIGRVRRLDRILVIADIHIGDALFTQGAVRALRDHLPDARIDYVVHRAVLPLIGSDPAVSRYWGLFNGGRFPTSGDLACLRQVGDGTPYDLILNFCPFFRSEYCFRGTTTIDFMAHCHEILMNERGGTGINHFLYQQYHFVRRLLGDRVASGGCSGFVGATLFLSDEAVDRAWDFLSTKDLLHRGPLVFLNPETASPYTKIPDLMLSLLLRGLTRLPAQILLGSGHTDLGVERRLLPDLPREQRDRVMVVPPELPIDAYAALADLCAVYLSGDTGPLHIAAARKISVSGKRYFRNRTSIVSIFGATPARMSGYDSARPGFMAANQDAPSSCHVSSSPCRNITCLNKMLKTCRNALCFESLDIDRILEDVRRFLNVTRLGERIGNDVSPSGFGRVLWDEGVSRSPDPIMAGAPGMTCGIQDPGRAGRETIVGGRNRAFSELACDRS